MSRVAFFFDGFNLYHALNDNRAYHQYKWLDLTKLAACFVTKLDTVDRILYFTAYAYWSTDKVKRHRLITSIYADMGVEIVEGVFRYKEKHCPKCYNDFWTPEEKRTDVSLAVKLFELAYKDEYDTAFIVSGDSDLIPAIDSIKTCFPEKKVGVVVPIARRAKELTKAAHFRRKMKLQHLKTSQLDRIFVTTRGMVLECPPEWQ